MNQWKISIPINGFHAVMKKGDRELVIRSDKTKFHYRGDQIVATTIVNSNNDEEAIKKAKYMINKSLSKICFAYNIEPSIKEDGYYIADISNNPVGERIVKSLVLRWGFLKEDPKSTLSKIESLPPEKLDVLNLALAYYKLGEYRNPLRIESFFSSITVIIRDIINKDHVFTNDLKREIKNILHMNNRATFNETEFEKDWQDCYIDERCSIAHGGHSKLVDPRMRIEHDELVNKIHSWATEVIHYYIYSKKSN